MSTETDSVTAEGEAPSPVKAPEQKATPIQMAMGCGFLIVCVAICGGVFGWFKKDKSEGLGVSREAFTSTFSKIGFAFRPGSDYRSHPTEEGASSDGKCIIKLVGPRDDLVYVSMATNMEGKRSNDENTLHGLYTVGLLHTAIPSWNAEGIMEWMKECSSSMKPLNTQFEKNMDGKRVRLVMTPNPVTMTISVESKDW